MDSHEAAFTYTEIPTLQPAGHSDNRLSLPVFPLVSTAPARREQ